MKLEQARKIFKDAQEERERIKSELEELRIRSQDLAEKAEAAAEDGNVEGYMRLKAQADRAAAEAHVRELRLGKLGKPVPESDLIDCWEKEQRPIAEKQIREAKAHFEQSREDFYRSYMAWLETCYKACQIREEIMIMAGRELYTTNLPEEFSAFPIDGLPHVWNVKEEKQFFRRINMPIDQEKKYQNMLTMGRSF